MEQIYQKEALELPVHQSTWKFCLLCFLSAGLYLIYWQYKSWSYIKQREQSNIEPFWRAFFSILFTISLNIKIAQLASDKKGVSLKNQSIFAGIGFIALSLISRLPDPFWLIYLFAFVPLIPVAQYQNFYISEEYPEAPVISKLNGWEIAITIIGGILISLVILSFLFPIPDEQ